MDETFNIFWMMPMGILVVITHVFFIIFFMLTIVGIPFAKEHSRIFILCLQPFQRNVD